METKINKKNIDNYIKFDTDNSVKLSETYAINYQNVLGSGAFGTIYLGFDFRSCKEIAIKMESQKTKNSQLIYESKILKLLQGGSKNNI
jgi:predicted Ser/Thr protein kinase